MGDVGRELSWAPLQRVAENPFFILDIGADATKAQIRSRGRALCDALANAEPWAAKYFTPLGNRLRTPELVTWATAELLDPDRRLGHELWHFECSNHQPIPAPEPWPSAMRAYGWRSQ